MIIGHIENLAKDWQQLPQAIQQALTFIKNSDFAGMADGEYEIDGDKIFARVQSYQTKATADCRLEAHDKYLDLQYVASGEEYLGYVPLVAGMEPAEVIADNDVKFYDAVADVSRTRLGAGVYAVLYPDDGHRPCQRIKDAVPVKKVVVKISVDRL